MLCSDFSDSLTLEAHAALQYMARMAKRNSAGDYRSGLKPLLGYMSPATAGMSIGLLCDVQAILPMPETRGQVIYRVEATCVCDVLLLAELPLQELSPSIDNYALDSDLTSKTRMGPNAHEGSRSYSTDGRVSPSETEDEVEPEPFVVPEPTSKEWNPERGKGKKGTGKGWHAKDPYLWNAKDLADYFGATLVERLKQDRRATAGEINHGAVRINIYRWQRQGWDSPEIKAMIDAFCVNPEKWCRNGTPAWRAFLANSTRLHARVAKPFEYEKAATKSRKIVGMANKALFSSREK